MSSSSLTDFTKLFIDPFKYPASQVVKDAPQFLDCSEIASLFFEKPGNTVMKFLLRLEDIVSQPNCRINVMVLSFLDLHREHVPALIKLMQQSHSVQFIDLRAGNRLDSQDVEALESFLSKSSSRIQIFVCQTELSFFKDGRSPSRKIINATQKTSLEELIESQKNVELPAQNAHRDYQWAMDVFRGLHKRPVEVFETLGGFEILHDELKRRGKFERAADLMLAKEVMLQEPPLSVVDWALSILKDHNLAGSIYSDSQITKEVVNLARSHKDPEAQALRDAVAIVRSHVSLILDKYNFTEKTPGDDPFAVRQQIDNLRSKGDHESADDLEDAMEKAMQWNSSCGILRKKRLPEGPRENTVTIIR
eukprot:PhF_6_TR19148/c0_g1_i1/m.28164